MTQRRAIAKPKLAGGVLVGAVASALAITALGSAGAANASCVSANGYDLGQGCTSSPGSASVALGRDALADSNGLGNLAVAVGNPGYNPAYGTVLPTHALADGTGNLAFAIGDGTNSGSKGWGNSSASLGNGSNAYSYGGNSFDGVGYIPQPGNGNVSLALGNGSESGAVGNHQLSTAFGNRKTGQNNGLKPASPSN